MKINEPIECPLCTSINITNDFNVSEMNEVGKAVIECQGCGLLFMVRDDGDGEYTTCKD